MIIIDLLLPNQATFWLMEGMLECYVQEKPSGEENLQALIYLLFLAGTANCVHLRSDTRSLSPLPLTPNSIKVLKKIVIEG